MLLDSSSLLLLLRTTLLSGEFTCRLNDFLRLACGHENRKEK
jgi:hypothetical protein